MSVLGNFLFASDIYFRDHRPFFSQKLLTFITRKILNRLSRNSHTICVFVREVSLGNYFFAPVKYFRDHRSFSFFAKTLNIYNSKNTEPIEPQITHHNRVVPVSVLGKFVCVSQIFSRSSTFFFFRKNF